MARARSVLLVVENLPVPYDRRVWQEALVYREAGFRVSVLSPATAKFPGRHEVIDGIYVYRYPMLVEGQGHLGLIVEYIWAYLCIFFFSIWIALRRGFDLLHVANPPDIFFPIMLFWRVLGRRVIFDHHDLTPELFATKFRTTRSPILAAFYIAEWFTLRVAHAVISTNESYKQVAITRGGRRPEDVVVIRNAPNVRRFALLPPEFELKRNARFLITFLGEIGEQDGVDVLIRALKPIRDALGEGSIHCAILGGGPFYDRLVRYAEEQNVADMITFTGRADDRTICRFLSVTDVAVDPCPYSPHADISTATKVMEYMFFSLPIVAFDLTETRRSAGDTAVYARRGDEDDFARQIVQLLQREEQRKELGALARARLDSELAWTRSAERLTTLAHRLASA